ncbi:MAG TPA: aminopeptidase [Oculatellaceae cyanobacterium]
MPKLTHAEKLDRLAQVAVHVGLRPSEGQEVFLTAPVEALPLVRLATQHLYRAGVSLVTTILDDPALSAARIRYAPDAAFDVAAGWFYEGVEKAFSNGAARMAITGSDPGALAGLDQARIGRAAKSQAVVYKPVSDLIVSSAINWSIFPSATRAWAKTVFPDLPERRAEKMLWDAIFKATRADAEDPIAAWDAHNKGLLARRAWLNEKHLSALHFRGPGTDLVVGLARGHVWAGGVSETKRGLRFNPNLPTEEVFSAPDRSRVSGYVTSTKPLSLRGSVLKGIRVTFADGGITQVTADQGQQVFERLIETDEGARFLGEVALVPHSSPISASGLLFYNTLFDENAACHIAVGQSYSKCIAGGAGMSDEELFSRGANRSNVHTDWMIGGVEVDVDGIGEDGSVQPIMRKGEWAVKI